MQTQRSEHDAGGAGRQLLSRARGNLKSALWKSGAIRQALAPEAAHDVIDVEAVANRTLPTSDMLRRRVLAALRDETGWSLNMDSLNGAMARWLSGQLESCLEEVWTSRVRIKIRVTRHEISVVSIDGRASPNVGTLP
jgi:hypothetical protein